MSIYNLPPGDSYLSSVVDIILKKYSTSLDEVIIVIPNGTVAMQLKYVFAQKLVNQVSFVPRIILAQDLYKVLDKNLYNIVSKLEAKLLLSDILKKMDFKLLYYNEALKLSEQVYNSFEQMFLRDIVDFKELSDQFYDLSEHLNLLISFLPIIHKEFYASVAKLEKVTPAQAYVFSKKELQKIIHNNIFNKPLFLVGILPQKYEIWLYDVVFNYKYGCIFLPQISFIDNAFCSDIRILENIKLWLTDKSIIDIASYNNIGSLQNTRKTIECLQCETIFLESSWISNKIIDLLSKNPDTKIAVITCDEILSKLIENHINSYGFKSNNLVSDGYSFVVGILLSVAKLISEFSCRNILNLLKTPEIIDDTVFELEIYIVKKGYDTILSISELKEYYSLCSKLAILEWANITEEKKSFLELFEVSLKIMELFSLNIWDSKTVEVLSQVVKDIKLIGEIPVKEYHDIFVSVLSEFSFKEEININATLFIVKASHGHILCSDYVFISGFTEESWISNIAYDPWFNDFMLNKLDLITQKDHLQMSEYVFYISLFYRKNIYISYVGSEGCRFLLDLECGMLFKYFQIYNHYHIHTNIEKQDIITSCGYGSLPDSISATGIEQLIRNPYGYYAKKILKLENQLSPQYQISDFGTFIHNVLAEYSSKYNVNEKDPYSKILNIGQSFSKSLSIENHLLWWEKFQILAQEFVLYESKRRPYVRKLYLEVFGKINICGKAVIAVADRIEILKNGDVVIIDYKTGGVPSKSDVLRGLSPQLMIEAIIASSGGIIGVPPVVPKSLTYIKISSSWPYYNILKIPIDEEIVQMHKKGLENLLQYFINKSEYIAYPNLEYQPKYDDYIHLARKID